MLRERVLLECGKAKYLCICVLSPSSFRYNIPPRFSCETINWCILTLGLRGMQKHGSNIQSKLMGLTEGLVISCLVLIISC